MAQHDRLNRLLPQAHLDQGAVSGRLNPSRQEYRAKYGATTEKEGLEAIFAYERVQSQIRCSTIGQVRDV